MRSLKSQYLLLLLFVTVCTACSKDDPAPVNTPPEITITSPTDAEMAAGFNRGEQITINGNVTDDKEISSLSIEIFYGGNLLYGDEETDIAQDTYQFSQPLAIPSLAPTGEYTVTFVATDSEGLSETVEKIIVIR